LAGGGGGLLGVGPGDPVKIGRAKGRLGFGGSWERGGGGPVKRRHIDLLLWSAAERGGGLEKDKGPLI